jgi:hypothetical protein
MKDKDQFAHELEDLRNLQRAELRQLEQEAQADLASKDRDLGHL